MNKKLVLFILLLFSALSFGQGWLPVGARSNSLANAVVADVDAWSYFHNPGALGYMTNASIGATYENRYLLKELQHQAIVYAQPLKAGVLSVGVQSFGFKVYRANRFGVGYALKLHEKLSMGVQLNYQDVWVQNYDYVGTVTAEFGLLSKITKRLSLGFSVMNINRARVRKSPDERFGTFFRLGLKYEISNLVGITAEVEKEVRSKIRPKIGVDYQMIKDFYLRVGASFNPAEIAFGLGYRFKIGLNLDAGSAWRQHLGWSPHIGLTYHFKTKQKE